MASTFFDAGDEDRLEREAHLTEQAPRAEFHEPKETEPYQSPEATSSISTENDDYTMAMLEVLRRLINE